MQRQRYAYLPAALYCLALASGPMACGGDDGRADASQGSLDNGDTGISGDGDPSGNSNSNSNTNGDGDPTNGDGDPDPTNGDGDPSGDGDPTTTNGDGDPDPTGNDPKWDTLATPDSNIPDLGCTKVDFMYVVDNSGSMSSVQNNLVANYPAFIQNIENSLDSVNEYQVGVMTTDTYNYNIAGCQNDLSALVSKTGGSNSSNAICGPFADGYNFMTESDDLGMAFQCAARVGTSGDAYELTMDTVVEGVQEPLDAPNLCNHEYLREDSLLVIMIVTDEADGTSPHMDPDFGTSSGTPQSWFDDVVAARGDIETNVVVVSFINYNGGACPPNSNYNDGENIKQFTEMFTYGYLVGICEPDFGPVLAQAIDVIDEACDNYISPG